MSLRNPAPRTSAASMQLAAWARTRRTHKFAILLLGGKPSIGKRIAFQLWINAIFLVGYNSSRANTARPRGRWTIKVVLVACAADSLFIVAQRRGLIIRALL